MSTNKDSNAVGRLYDNLLKSGKISEKELGAKDKFVGAVNNYDKASKLYSILSDKFTPQEIGTETEFLRLISPQIEKTPSYAEAMLSRKQARELNAGAGSIPGIIQNKIGLEDVWNKAGNKAQAKLDARDQAVQAKEDKVRPTTIANDSTSTIPAKPTFGKQPQKSIPSFEEVQNGAKMDTSAIKEPANWNAPEPVQEEGAEIETVKQVESQLSDFEAKNGDFLKKYNIIKDKIEAPNKEMKMGSGDSMPSPIELFRNLKVARNLSKEEMKFYEENKKQFESLSRELQSLHIRKDHAELAEQLNTFSHTKSFTGKMWDGIVKSGLAKDFATFGLTEMSRNYTVMETLKKEAKEGKGSLTDWEKKLVDSHFLLTKIQQEDRGGWYTTGVQARMMIPFIASMIGTASIAGWGMQATKGFLKATSFKAAKELGKRSAAKYIMQKGSQLAFANMVRTPFTPTFYTNLGQKRIEDFSQDQYGNVTRNNDTLFGDTYRAFTENTLEYLGEGLGEYMGARLLTKAISNKRATSQAINNLFKTLDKVTENPAYKGVSAMLEKAQIHGVPQEVGEEIFTALSSSALTGSEDYKELKNPWFYFSIAINTAMLGGAGMGAKFAAGGTSHMIGKGVTAWNANKAENNFRNIHREYLEELQDTESEALTDLGSDLRYAVSDEIYTDGDTSALNILNKMAETVNQIPEDQTERRQKAEKYLQLAGDMVVKSAMRTGMYDGIVTKMEESLGGKFLYNKNPKQVLIVTNDKGENFYLIDKTEPEVGKPIYAVRNTATGESVTLTEADIENVTALDSRVFVEEWMKNADLEGQNAAPVNPVNAQENTAINGDNTQAPTDTQITNEPLVTDPEQPMVVAKPQSIIKGAKLMLAGYPVTVLDVTEEGVIVSDEKGEQHFVEPSDLFELPVSDAPLAETEQPGHGSLPDNLPPPPADIVNDGNGNLSPYNPEEQSAETQPEIPMTEDGAPDYDAMTPQQLLSQLTEEVGPEEAVKMISQQIDSLIERKDKLSVKKVTSMNEAVKLKKELDEINGKITALTEIVPSKKVVPQDPSGQTSTTTQQPTPEVIPVATNPVAETIPQATVIEPKKKKARVKRDPNVKPSITIFREDMLALGEPQTEREYIAWRVMTGTKIRMGDKVSNNGSILSPGLASMLGIRGKAEKRRYIGLMDNKKGLTPEQIAHQIWEENGSGNGGQNGLFAGKDTMEILDMVVDVLAEVYSKRSALEFIQREREYTGKGTDIDRLNEEHEQKIQWLKENGQYELSEAEINEIIEDLYQETFVTLSDEEHAELTQFISDTIADEEYQKYLDSLEDFPEDLPTNTTNNDTREDNGTEPDTTGTTETIQSGPTTSDQSESSDKEGSDQGAGQREGENGAGGQSAEVARKGNNVNKAQRTAIDDEIDALEKTLKEARAERDRLIKNNSDRNGLFGDTKEDPNDLFGGEGFDPSATQALVDRQNDLIKTLEGKIAKLNASKETGAKEASGQLSIDNTNAGNNSTPIMGIEDLTEEEILQEARAIIEDIFEESDIDAKIVGMAIIGSRKRGDAKAKSDLDIVVQYDGDYSEDGIFNVLNESTTRINGIKVDFNPINANKTGTLDDYLAKARRYDDAKLGSKPAKEKKPTSSNTNSPADVKKPAETKTFGADNKIISTEDFEAVRAKIRAKLNNLNAGFDPELSGLMFQAALYYIEAGARKFKDFAKIALEDFGEKIKPYLKAAYYGVRDFDGMKEYHSEMDSIETVSSINLDKLNAEEITDIQNNSLDSQKGKESENQKPQSNDNRRRKETENSEVGEKDRQEVRGSEPEGMDRGGQTDIRNDEGRNGSVPGSSAGTEQRKATNQVKKNQSNNRGERGVNYAPTSPKARFNANIEAIKLLRTLQEQGVTTPSKEQMAILRKYSGWGGLGTFFNNRYTPENELLKSILSVDEYSAAELSLNSAYFTPASIIDSLWDVAKSLGFEGGKVLESSAGIGNILGNMPQNINEKSDIQAVEIDLISGEILKLLYPDANVTIEGFQDVHIPSGSIDLAITNVPFVTGLSVYDSFNKDLSRKFKDIHDFFIAKNTRALKEGGIGIFITSNGTLDKSKKLREWLVTEGSADVIGAFRLNNETFEGTSVTSDIIIIRKRIDGKVSPDAIDVMTTSEPRVHKEDTGKTRKNRKTGENDPVYEYYPLNYNSYFVNNPQNMGGEMFLAFEKGSDYRGASAGLYPSSEIDQTKALEKWAKSFSPQEKAKQIEENKSQNNEYEATTAKEGSLIINSKGEFANAKKGRAVPNTNINSNKVKGRSKSEVLRDYDRLKTAVDKALEYQLNNEDDSGLEKLLKELNNAYDNFVGKYGAITKNMALSFLRHDAYFPSVTALEKYSEEVNMDGKKVITVSKQEIFKSRIIGKTKEFTPTTLADGVVTSIHKHNAVKVDYIAKALGIDEDTVRNEILNTGLAFVDPQTGGLEVRHNYLSGNVREKLALAIDLNENGKYDKNIEELNKVIPMDIPAHLIEFTLGSRWIPAEIYKKFFKEVIDVRVDINNDGAGWNVDFVSNAHNEMSRAYGVKSEIFDEVVYGHLLIEAAMANKSIIVSKVRKYKDGTSETVHDKDATQACATRISEIKDQFKEWAREKMLADSELSDRVTRIYNDKHNAIVPLSISDEFIPDSYPGMNLTIDLYIHQRRAVMKAMTSPLMFAHEVGTGKTFTLITTAMEMRRLGTAKKPMIVVQNATLGQFLAEAKLLYPNSKVLTIAEADKTPEGRREFYAKIKYGDWDMIIIPQSIFSMIPDSKEREARFIEEKIEEKLEILENLKKRNENSIQVGEVEREIKKLRESLSDIFSPNNEKDKKIDAKKEAAAIDNVVSKTKEKLDRKVDDVENFDQMDIDALLIDEAHNYKRLGFATGMSRIKGIDSAASKKAASTFLKAQSILEKTGWKNVVFATGTPISNTAAEIWTFMKYLTKKEEMKSNDIYNFDDFVANFGNVKQMLEFTTSGKFKENTRFASYVNMPELIRLWANVSDTVLTKDISYVNDKVPKMETGGAQDIMLPQSRSLVEIMNGVRARLQEFEEMSGKEKRTNSHIPLVMYGIAKRAAIDPRLVAKNAKDEELSKTNKSVEQTLKSLNETADYKGTVAVFCDSFQRKENKIVTFDLFEDIKSKLVAQGVPENQIAIIRSGMTMPKKKKIFEDINTGNIRVVMGSTSTLGTGVNIQERLHTVIHMDAPDRPMDYTQRNGRIIRQGNMHRVWNKEVRIIRFGVEDSLDVTSYQRLKTKSAFIDSVMSGKSLLENIFENRILEEDEDGLFDNMLAVISGSQYAMLKNKAERELRKLVSKKKQHNSDQAYIYSKLKENAAKIERLKKVVENNKKSYETIKKFIPDGKVESMIIEGEVVNNNETEIDSFFKEKINTKVNEYIEKARDNSYFREGTISFNVQIADLKFVIDVDIVKHSEYDTERKLSKTTMKRAVKLSSSQLGIEREHVFGAYPKEAIKSIIEQYVDGKTFLSSAERAESDINATHEENRLMNERKGKAFDKEAELKEAENLVDEYTKLMKIEMEEKEQKYKNVSSTGIEVDTEFEEEEDSETDDEDDDDIVFRERETIDVDQEDLDLLFRNIGTEGAQRIDQSQGVKTRMQSLELAELMEDKGEDSAKIRLITGWERGVDKKWRYEIGGGEFMKNTLNEKYYEGKKSPIYESFSYNGDNLEDMLKTAKLLGDVWSQKELYEAYPSFKNVPIALTIDPSIKIGPEEKGIFSEPDQDDAPNGFIYIAAGTVERAKYILVHEIQHAIQRIEGFANGMNKFIAADVRPKSDQEKKIDKIFSDVENYLSKVDAVTTVTGNIDGRTHWDIIKNHLKGDALTFMLNNTSEGKTLKQIKELIEEYRAEQRKEDYKYYWTTAGEVEARSVSERLSLSPRERRLKTLRESEDVDRGMINIFMKDDFDKYKRENGFDFANAVSNRDVEPVYNSFVEKASKELNMVFENWRSKGLESEAYKPNKREFIEWLFTDTPDSNMFAQNKVWVNAIAKLRKLAASENPKFDGYTIIPAIETIEVDGVNKPVNDSNGEPIARTDNEIQEFWRWFDGSAIVDNEGMPLTLYHGTPVKGITEFDIDKAGSNVQADFGAIFFTDSLRLAEDFSHERLPSDIPFMHKLGKKGEIHKARIKMKKPFDLRNMTEDMAKILIQEGAIVPLDIIMRDAKAPNKELIKSHLPFNISELAKYGYDGIIGNLNQYGATEYAVFSNDNIKLIKDSKAGNNAETINQKAEKHLVDGPATYTELQPHEIPQNTQVAYKLMRYFKSTPGVLYPLYAKDGDVGKKGFKKGTWYKAEQQSVQIGGKSLANRPGIHAVDLPLFLQGKANVKGETRVWAKVEMPAMNEKTQAENDKSELLANGQRAGIRDRVIGPDEAYNFKTNPSATGAGSWPIAGSMKIVEVLSDDEISKILSENDKSGFIAESMTGDPSIIFRTDETEKSREQEVEELRIYAEEVATALGVPIKIITDINQIPARSERKRKALGWYSPTLDTIVIIVPNHKSKDDVKATILHEAVGHKGLRGLLGARFDRTMDRVFQSLPSGVKAKYLAKYGNTVTAAEEFLSEMAEAELPVSTWNKIKAIIKEAFRAIGINLQFSDTDLAFMLWRSKNRLESGKNQSALDAMRMANEESKARERFKEMFESREPMENEVYRDNDNGPITNNLNLNNVDRVIEGWQDRMISGKRLIEEVQRRGGKVGTFANFYSEEVRASSRARYELDEFQDKFFTPITKIVKTWGKDHGFSIEEIEDYMIAKHAPERNKELVSREVFEYVIAKQKRELNDLQTALRLTDNEKAKESLQTSVDLVLLKMQITKESGDRIIKSIYDQVILKEGTASAPSGTSIEEALAYADIMSNASTKMKAIDNSEERNNRSGLLDDAANRIVEEFEAVVGANKAVDFWDKVREATSYTTRKAEGYDLIDSEDRERYENTYQYYVPLRGWREKEEIDYQDIFGEGYQGHEILNKVKKSAKGRTSLAGNVLGNIASMAESTIASGSKNEVRKSAWRLVVSNSEMRDLFLIKDAWQVNIAPEGQEPEWIIVYEPPTQSMIDSGKAEKVPQDKSYEWRKTKAQLTKHQVPVFINGRRVVIEFKGSLGARVASAINGENIAHLDWKPAKAVSAMTRTMAALRTSKNPDFMLTNFVRDFFFGNMAYYVRGGDIAKLNKNIAIAFSAIHKGMKPTHGNTYISQMYNDFREAGGQTGYVHLYGEEKFQKEIENMLKDAKSAATISPALYAKKAVKGINKALDYMAHMSEDAMRFAVYLTEIERLMKEEGESNPTAAMMKKAALASKESTVNFNRKGKYTTVVNGLYAFFNASIQGTSNYLSLAKENPAKFIKAHLAILTLRTVLHALWSMMYGDDDDEKTYSEISDYVKENNFVFVLGGRFVTLPLPHAARALTNIGPLMVDVIRRKTNPEDAVDSYLKNMISEVSPINMVGLDKSAYIPASMSDLLLTVSPTVFRPLAEVALNKDYMARPIERENFISTDDNYLPRHQNAYENTNKILVGASKLSNRMAGGNDFRTAGLKVDEDGNVSRSNFRALADISPAYVEHIIEGYLGGVGRFVNDSYKTLRSVATLEKPKLQNIPVLRRFYQEPFESLGWQKYYEIRSRVNDIENAKKAAEKENNRAEFIGLNNFYNNSIVMTYETYNGRIVELSKLQRDLPEKDERRKQIDEMIDQAMTEMAVKIKEIDVKFNKTR